MKRSEAISFVNKYLEENSIYQIHPETIIELVEVLGMFPPATNADLKSTGYALVYKWEPEDEKK